MTANTKGKGADANGIYTAKRTHSLWMKDKKPDIKQIVGKTQYIYSSSKGRVSLVKFLDYLRDGKDFWEIYCLDGDLFDDCERFKSKALATKRVIKLLREV